MLRLKETSQFRKDIKHAMKRKKNLGLLQDIISTLIERKPLDPKYQDHPLRGPFSGFRECHIENDWLLMYAVDEDDLVLTALRTGTHSDLFG
ncbi:MAG: type II toxin-antitoxin system YafQ family toxin [Spirochaetaceae bacterium]|jgi:mRNA interferase YafQ|nr:type II toxin-antitoxin system YafQ family toxin [Spirochaetaceae bacterium]